MRAITAWLALWDDAVRQELIEREPETLISFGDPGALPLPARKDLVQRIRRSSTVRMMNSLRGSFSTTLAGLRIQNSHLSYVNVGQAEPPNHDVRGLLLQLIWQGPVRGCADLAYVAACNTDCEAGNRIAAIRALLACGCNDRVRELANEMLTHPECWPAEIVFGVASDMFPDIIGAEELATLIEKRSRVSGRPIRNFDWSLRQAVEAVEPGSEQAIDLRGKIGGPHLARARGRAGSSRHQKRIRLPRADTRDVVRTAVARGFWQTLQKIDSRLRNCFPIRRQAIDQAKPDS